MIPADRQLKHPSLHVEYAVIAGNYSQALDAIRSNNIIREQCICITGAYIADKYKDKLPTLSFIYGEGAEKNDAYEIIMAEEFRRLNPASDITGDVVWKK